MSVIRARQRAMTAVLPHQGNRRYAIPSRPPGVFTGSAWNSILAVGDSWAMNGAVVVGSVPQWPFNTSYQAVGAMQYVAWETNAEDATYTAREGEKLRPQQQTRGMVRRMPDMLAIYPNADGLVIIGSANDFPDFTTIIPFADKILRLALANPNIKDVIFGGIEPTPAYANNYANAKSYDNTLKSLCARYGAGYLDMQSIGVSAQDGSLLPEYQEQNDSHMNTAGATLLGDAISAMILDRQVLP
jgi:hypothetical protein